MSSSGPHRGGRGGSGSSGARGGRGAAIFSRAVGRQQTGEPRANSESIIEVTHTHTNTNYRNK